LSQFMPWWMVTPNSKPEKSMAMGLGDDVGDAYEMVVADSGLSHHSFLGNLGLTHAHGPEAVLDALPSSLCRQPLLRRRLWNGRSEVCERKWSSLAA
jgi:hypothetical protein